MEKVVLLMNKFADKVNECRADGRYEHANDYLNMLCGAMCAFNEYELGNKKQATLEEVNHEVRVVIINA